MQDNLSRKAAYNTFIQIAGRVLGLLIALITVHYLTNYLVVNGSSLVGYGQYTIVFTYVTILGSIADFGLFTLLVREITNKSEEESGRLIGSAIVFRFLLMIFTLIVFMFLVKVMPYPEIVKQGIIIGVLIAFSMLFSQAVEAIFQAKLQSEKIVIVETSGKIVIAALTIYSLHLGYGLIPVVAINLIGQLTIFILGLILASKLTRIRIQLDLQLWRDISPQFWTIALVDVLALIHFKSDTLLLTLFKPSSDVAIYGVAYKILEVLLILPSIFATNLLPVFSGLFIQGNQEQMNSEIRRSSSILFIVSSYIAILLVILAPWIVVFITKQAYIAAAIPLRILAISILFSFLTTLLSQAIIAARQQGRLVKGYILVVIINIGLNLWAIPRYSYIGAATTTAITEAILVGYTMLIGHQSFGKIIHWSNLSRILLTAILTLVLMVGVVHFLPIWPSPDSLSRLAMLILMVKGALIGGFIYIAILFLSFGGSRKKLKGIIETSL